MTCTARGNAVLAALPVRRREDRGVDRHCVRCLRHDGRRERLRGCWVDRRLCGIGKEDEGRAGRGHRDLAHVLRLVALHGLDVFIALPCSVDLEAAAEGLPGPGDVVLLGHRGGAEVPADVNQDL